MFELYYLKQADSICSNRVIMTLSEKGIDDWIPHPISLMEGEQFEPEYLKLNPKAQVPTLVHDGKVIRESSIICDYIDGSRPVPALKPRDPAERAVMQEWIKDCDETGYQATAAINFVAAFRLSAPIDKMEARWKRATDIDRIHRQQSCIRNGMGSPYVLRAIGGWERIFKKAEAALSDGRPWIMGDQFTLVETNYAPFIKVLEMLRILDIWLEDRPNLRRWWEAVRVRPSYTQLEDYPGQDRDDDAPHAKAGRDVAPEVREILEHYRSTMPN